MPSKKESAKTRQLREKLSRQSVRIWDKVSKEEKAEIYTYAEDYIAFLNRARTERKTIQELSSKCREKGFVDIGKSSKKDKRLFQVSRGKMILLAVQGKKPPTEGVRIVTSHVDCPRLDLKPNPLYEDSGIVLLKTHYYGGIKKYHWVGRTLAICGTIIRSDGSIIDVNLGLDPNDPVFTIPDLLPHLSRKQMEQKANEFIPAENLNIIFGFLPYEDKDADQRTKLAVLELLSKKYGITEEDFISAELQVVPAEPARSAGIDSSLVAGYGQDDRICVYTSSAAVFETTEPEYTSVAVFFDKEEVGSEGNTSAKSLVFELFMMELMEKFGVSPTRKNLHKVLIGGKALSADVTAAFDPTYPDVYEKRNCSLLGHGINVTKYTGHGGKYMASDANAEYASWIRKLFNENSVAWQAGDLGKVDEGGGGTVAKYLANMGIDIIDCGPPILGMHSPLEVSSKDDVWMCHKAFKVFFNN